MRHLYGTKNTSTSNVSVALITDTSTRVVSLTVKSRATNGNAMFLGFDSGVSSNAGWELTEESSYSPTHSFHIDDDNGRPLFIEDDTSNDISFRAYGAAGFYASVSIPTGYKATHAVVYDNNPAASTYKTFSSSIGASGGALSAGLAGGSTSTNTEADITDITGGGGVYCILAWNPTLALNRCYGGRITLAKA